jgi:hypothetical protein
MGFWAFVKARFSRKPSLSDPALAAVYGVPQGAAEQILNRVAAEFLDTKNAEARMIHNVIENYSAERRWMYEEEFFTRAIFAEIWSTVNGVERCGGMQIVLQA